MPLQKREGKEEKTIIMLSWMAQRIEEKTIPHSNFLLLLVYYEPTPTWLQSRLAVVSPRSRSLPLSSIFSFMKKIYRNGLCQEGEKNSQNGRMSTFPPACDLPHFIPRTHANSHTKAFSVCNFWFGWREKSRKSYFHVQAELKLSSKQLLAHNVSATCCIVWCMDELKTKVNLV